MEIPSSSSITEQTERAEKGKVYGPNRSPTSASPWDPVAALLAVLLAAALLSLRRDLLPGCRHGRQLRISLPGRWCPRRRPRIASLGRCVASLWAFTSGLVAPSLAAELLSGHRFRWWRICLVSFFFFGGRKKKTEDIRKEFLHFACRSVGHHSLGFCSRVYCWVFACARRVFACAAFFTKRHIGPELRI